MKKLPLNFYHLKYFLDAVRLGSISSSAKTNNMSQSAISQAITKLEKELGCLLLSHLPKKFKLTDDGQQLYTIAKELFSKIKEAEEGFFSNQQRHIRFGCSHSIATAFFPTLLTQCKKDMPNVRINCRIENGGAIVESVKKGIYDFGILLDIDDLSPFDIEEVYHGAFRLYTSKKYKQDYDLPFMLDSEERPETNLLKKAYKRKYGKELPVLIEVSSWEIIADLAEKGLGIAFIPDYVALNRKGTLKEYQGKIIEVPYRIFAIFSSDNPPNTSVRQFLQLFKTSFKLN